MYGNNAMYYALCNVQCTMQCEIYLLMRDHTYCSRIPPAISGGFIPAISSGFIPAISNGFRINVGSHTNILFTPLHQNLFIASLLTCFHTKIVKALKRYSGKMEAIKRVSV